MIVEVSPIRGAGGITLTSLWRRGANQKIFLLYKVYFLAKRKERNIKPNKIAGNTNSAINHKTKQARSTKPTTAPIQRKTTSHVCKSFFDDCLFCCFGGILGIDSGFCLMLLFVICRSAIRIVKGLSLDKVLKISSAEIPSFIHSTICLLYTSDAADE